jgi:ABC-type Fe3+ transport system permease subunit
MTNPNAGTTTAERERAMRPVIRLVAVYLGLSILIALLVGVFHHSVLEYQFAHAANHDSPDPAVRKTVRDSLSWGLWSRPITSIIILLVYLRIIKGLRTGKRSSYRRIRVVAIVVTVLNVYYIATGQNPVWMSIGQGLQIAVLIGVFVLASRPEVKAHFQRAPGS